MSLGRPRCRWEDNIKIDLEEVVWESLGFVCLLQDRDHLVSVPDTQDDYWSGSG